MRPRHFEQRGRIVIDAPIERVYTMASDPQVVPTYAGEIARIELLRERPHGARDVKSFIRVLGVTIPFRYRYHHRPPVYYGGVQTHGWPVRGFFTMRFRALDENRTEVEHVEGIVSRLPLVAMLVGWIWFRLISREGIDDELVRLRHIVESATASARSLQP